MARTGSFSELQDIAGLNSRVIPEKVKMQRARRRYRRHKYFGEGSGEDVAIADSSGVEKANALIQFVHNEGIPMKVCRTQQQTIPNAKVLSRWVLLLRVDLLPGNDPGANGATEGSSPVYPRYLPGSERNYVCQPCILGVQCFSQPCSVCGLELNEHYVINKKTGAGVAPLATFASRDERTNSIATTDIDAAEERQILTPEEKKKKQGRFPVPAPPGERPDLTNAYGLIQFEGFRSNRPSKYIRASRDCQLAKLVKLAKEQWRLWSGRALSSPQIVLSITGSIERTTSDSAEYQTEKLRYVVEQMQMLKESVVETAVAARALITTAGICTDNPTSVRFGQLVAEQVRNMEYRRRSQRHETHDIQCLGITPWASIAQKFLLINEDQGDVRKLKRYQTVIDKSKSQLAYLEPNHSHFILMDDGLYGSQVTDLTRGRLNIFRAEIEIALAKAMGVPLVAAYVGGDSSDLPHMLKMVENNIPVIICYEFGGLADDLGGVTASAEATLSDDRYREFIERFCVPGNNGSKKESSADLKERPEDKQQERGHEEVPPKEMIEGVLKAYDKAEKMIKYVRNGSKFVSLQHAILHTIMKCQEGEDEEVEQHRADFTARLRLAISWKQDYMIQHMLSQMAPNHKCWNEVIEEILNKEDPIFLDILLLHRNAPFESFVQYCFSKEEDKPKQKIEVVRWFTKLCRRSKPAPPPKRIRVDSTNSRLQYNGSKPNQLEDDEEEVYTSYDKWILDEYFGEIVSLNNRDPCRSCFGFGDGKDDTHISEYLTQLFLRSLRQRKYQLAILLWERIDNNIIAALAAAKILDQMAHDTKADAQTKIALRENARKFESLAVGLTNFIYEADSNSALVIVERCCRSWGNLDCLSVADSAQLMSFFATTCVKRSNAETWTRGVYSTVQNELVSSFITHVFPINLILFLLPGSLQLVRVDDGEMGDAVYNKKVATAVRTDFTGDIRGASRVALNVRNKFYGARLICTSPQTRFFLASIYDIIFAIFYSHFILFELGDSVAFELPELVITGLLMVFAANSLANRLLTNPDTWNRPDICAAVIHGTGFICRVFMTKGYAVHLEDEPDRFEWARILYCATAVVLFYKLLRIYVLIPYLGTKLVILRTMAKHVMLLGLFAAIFVVGYGITSQAMLYRLAGTQRELDLTFIRNLVYYPFWQLFGELNLESAVEGKVEGCELAQETGNSSALMRLFNETRISPECPRAHWFVPWLLALHMLLGNILFMNFLIAIFTTVLQDIELRSQEVWNYEKWKLLKAFDGCYLPWICGDGGSHASGFKLYDQDEINQIKVMERKCLNGFLREMRENQTSKVEQKLSQMEPRIDGICSDTGLIFGEVRKLRSTVTEGKEDIGQGMPRTAKSASIADEL